MEDKQHYLKKKILHLKKPYICFYLSIVFFEFQNSQQHYVSKSLLFDQD